MDLNTENRSCTKVQKNHKIENNKKIEDVSKPTEKKMTLAPPKKKDNPKMSKQIKTKETNNKKKDKVKEDDPKQRKITNLFKPKLKTTSATEDDISSSSNIYEKDNNFEDDLTCEDNLGYVSLGKRKDRKPQTPDKPERQVLEKFPEGSNKKTKKNAPDLALTGLAGNQLFSRISNQHLASESWGPNDNPGQVETSGNSGNGSDSASLT